jgi:hypothetical protein
MAIVPIINKTNEGDRTMRALEFRTSRRLRHAALAATLLAAASTGSAASGAERQWYAGVTVDRASISVLRGDDVFSGYYDYGPYSSGYSLRGGLRLSRHLAVEAGFQRLGGVKWTEPYASVAGVSGLYDSQTTFDSAIDEICVVGTLPIGKIWELYLKGGVASYRFSGEQTLTDLTGAASVTRPVSLHGNAIPIAGGVKVAVGKSWNLGLELSAIEIKESFLGITNNDSASLGGWSIGAERRFGGHRGSSDTSRE